MMGGRIWAESDYGKGSTFSFTAEFRQNTKSAVSHELSDDFNQNYCEIKGLDNIRGARILLVEDNKTNQQVATGLLEGRGFKVTVAGSGKTAITRVNENNRFDAILMDIQMPVMDGYEVTRRLRKDDRFKSLPIIAMTAYAMEEDKKKCIAAGMNEHLSKPIDPRSLFAALTRWIPPLEHPVLSPKKLDKIDADIKLPLHLPGLNIKSGLDKIGGSIDGKKQLYKDVLKDFYSTYSDFSDTMTTAYTNGKIDTVKEMIHTIIGVSGNIGADELHGISKEMNECLKNEQPDELSFKLPVFYEEFKTVMDTIEHQILSDSFNAAAVIKPTLHIDELLKRLIKLEELLSQGRPEAQDLFDSAKDDLVSLGFRKEAKKLAEKIEDFEYEGAKGRLSLLKDKLKRVHS